MFLWVKKSAQKLSRPFSFPIHCSERAATGQFAFPPGKSGGPLHLRRPVGRPEGWGTSDLPCGAVNRCERVRVCFRRGRLGGAVGRDWNKVLQLRLRPLGGGVASGEPGAFWFRGSGRLGLVLVVGGSCGSGGGGPASSISLRSEPAMEMLGVVMRPAGVRRRLASRHVQEWLLDSGSMCSRRRLCLDVLEALQAGASGDAVLVWLLSGVLVLWTEGGDFPPSTFRAHNQGFRRLRREWRRRRTLISRWCGCWIGSSGTGL